MAHNYVTGCGTTRDTPVYYDDTNTWSQVGRVNGDFVTTELAGHPWLVSSSAGAIYRPVGTNFAHFDNSKPWATVAVGDPSMPFEIWATTTSGQIWVQNNVSFLDAGTPAWTQIVGAATKVAVFQEKVTCPDQSQSINVPFVINSSHQVFKYVFQNVGTCVAGTGCGQGCFQQVTGGPPGVADIAFDVALGTDNNIYQWANGAWSFVIGPTPGGPTTHIGGVGGFPWGIDSHGTIYRVCFSTEGC